MSQIIPFLCGVLLFYLYRVVRKEKQETLDWLRSNSNVIKTEHGTIEYAIHGQGKPLLYMHGGMGGFEQGLALGTMLNLEHFQLITFSRPGYRRTDIAIGGTLPEQAAAACLLLDHLQIEAASVLALSAGGMAALQFAQDYPARCKQLIMLSAQGPELAKTQPSPFWLWLLDWMMASDILVWVMMRVGIAILSRMMQVGDAHLQDSLPRIKNFFRGVFPATDWRVGTNNDVKQLLAKPTFDLTHIRVPTLIIHGSKDNIVPPAVATDNAAKIPKAEHITIENGTHLIMTTHTDEISDLICQFCKITDP